MTDAHVVLGHLPAKLLGGRMVLGGGLRLDEFRFQVAGRDTVGAMLAQPKANFSFRPSASFPVTLYANYGRGISTADARGVVRHPEQPAFLTLGEERHGLLTFDAPVRAAAPGQSAVFYDPDRPDVVLGGGIIARPEN